jgi:hypothetical protein
MLYFTTKDPKDRTCIDKLPPACSDAEVDRARQRACASQEASSVSAIAIKSVPNMNDGVASRWILSVSQSAPTRLLGLCMLIERSALLTESDMETRVK